MHPKSKRKTRKGQEEEERERNTKSKKTIGEKVEPIEFKQKEEPLVVYKHLHDKTANLTNLSRNMLGYLFEFLGIDEMLALMKVNKRSKNKLKENKMFKQFLFMAKKIKKEEISSPTFSKFEQITNTIAKFEKKLEKVQNISESQAENIIKKIVSWALPIIDYTHGDNYNLCKFIQDYICDKETNFEDFDQDQVGLIQQYFNYNYCNLEVLYTYNLEPEFFETFAPIIEKSTSLKYFGILTHSFHYNSDFRLFEYEFKNADEEIFPRFCKSISRSKSLKDIYLSYPPELPYAEMSMLVQSLNESSSIKKLTIDIPSKFDSLMSNSLAVNTNIKTLIFMNGLLNFDFLRQNKTIEKIIICSPEDFSFPIDEPWFESLANSLNKNYQENGIKLPNESNVRKLKLYPDSSDYKYIKHVVDIISNNSTITELFIRRQCYQLAHKDLDELFDALKTNRSLKKIELTDDIWISHSFTKFLEMLSVNECLETIVLCNKFFDIFSEFSDLDSLEKAVSLNKRTKEFSINGKIFTTNKELCNLNTKN